MKNLRRRFRAGTRKNKRNRDVGTRQSDTVVKTDRRIGNMPAQRITTRSFMRPQLSVVSGPTSSKLLADLDEFMKGAEPGDYTFRRNDPLTVTACRARLSRAAKKHGRKVSIHMEDTELTVVVGALRT